LLAIADAIADDAAELFDFGAASPAGFEMALDVARFACRQFAVEIAEQRSFFRML